MPPTHDSKFIESNLLGDGVEFVGLINRLGRVIDCSSRDKINLSPEQMEMFSMMVSLSLSMQRDYDNNLGYVEYIVTERRNSRIISVPVSSGTVMVVTNKKTNVSDIAKKILKAIDHIKGLDSLVGQEITA